MRKLLTLCLLIVSLSASAQWQQTGSKVRYVNGLGIPTKDTAAGVAADSSQILIRPADSSLYIKYKRTWVKVGAGGGGTITGSGTTNRVAKFTSSTAIGNSQITDNGTSVGINQTSPLYRLHVTSGGSAVVFTDAGSAAVIAGTNAAATVSSLLSLRGDTLTMTGAGINGAEHARINQSGRMLIGTTTDNGVDRLQVSGSAIASTLKFNTSGQSSSISNKYQSGTSGFNIFIGNGGGSLSGTSGDQSSYNISLGHNALLSLTTGYFNFAIGDGALSSNTTGYENVAHGKDALALNTSGYYNTAVGTPSMVFNTTGYKNTAIGHNSLVGNTTGYSNVAIGQAAGFFLSGGSNNQTSNQSIFIGEDTRASAAGNTNEMVFGHTAIGQGSNTVTLGNSSITKTFLRGNTMINTTTDNGVDELQVNGSISGIGFKQAYVTKTGAYTATNDDYIIDCTSGTFTVTLPASSGRTGRILIIKNSGAGTITVDGNASETIDGAATYSLATQYATIQIVSDGTNWKIISKF